MDIATAVPARSVEPTCTPTHVVGVGASAGGLEALERLFECMPAHTGVAFVVVQHLSPDFRSLTDELLARRTTIPIHRVENGMPIAPDAIYLLPPKKDMILSGGRLLLTDKDPTQLVALPIDHFFRSLAHELGDRAIAVVLSGTGSDGSRGLREVHEAGGLVIAQTPESAKFDGMPRSALETGAVHLSLTPEQIPDALLRHVKHPQAVPLPEPIPDRDLPAGLEAIFRHLREGHGIDFSHYKPDTVSRRIERRLLLNQSVGLEQYARRLASDPAELNLLYKDLLIGVTRFFRDEEAFKRLQRDVLPGLLERVPADEEFRAWVAGCATGEEAYSLAIAIRECLDQMGGRAVPVKVFATDVHRASLDSAGVGLFGPASLTEVSPERRARFFVPRGDDYQVSPELRKMVVFAHHNLIKDAPFTKLDLITCRNLLIYFTPAVQKKVLALFHFGLRAGGVLFLGPSESPGELGDEFDCLDTRWKVYRKRRDIRLAPEIRLPAGVAARPRLALAPTASPAESLGISDVLLGEFMPTSVLVNEAREVIQVFGGASRFLRLRDGRFSGDILDMVDPDMRVALSGALPRVFKEMKSVVYKGLRVEPAGEAATLDLTVRPIRSPRAGQVFALVALAEHQTSPAPPPGDEPREIDLTQAGKEQLLALESELRYTKENLQATIEEMETSNEELQATNEELVASNEELQSTNEELHSVNEELYTVNAEYQNKIAELTELTADMDNLLASTEVHTIFLDRSLCIRKFTPKIAETFNLMPQDIGRRIDHFTYSLDLPGLPQEIAEVLQEGRPRERQVRDRRGRWYLLRVLPYRARQVVEGVVLTLIDISAIKQAEAETRRKDRQLRAILHNSPAWVFVRDLQSRYVLTDDSFPRTVGCDPIGRTPRELFPPEVADALLEVDARVIRDGTDVESEVVIPLADGPHTFLSVNFPLRDEDGELAGVGGIQTDVTRLKRAEEQAREAVSQRDRFLAMLSHELRNPLAAILNAARVLQTAAEGQVNPATWLDIIERRSRHMSRLLDDLLDVARVTQDKIDIHKAVIDLVGTMAEVREEVEPWFTERRLQLIEERPDGPLPVEGDPDRLQQIQVNLLMNAAKYTPAEGRVWYRLSREGDEAVLRVRDTGVGMAPEMCERVFDLFVQADDTLARSSGGIGVGLTLVRAIVERHGGRVSAHSDGPGKGSEFVVRLPLARAALPAPARTEAAPRPAKAALPSLLVVEDDPDIRESLRRILALDGYAVEVAPDGPAALEAVRRRCPDAMVIDIGLPGLTGYEVARTIRRELDGRAPVLIALTGYGQPDDRLEAIDAGFNHHLTKPVQPAELTRVLASLGSSARQAGGEKAEAAG